MNEHIHELIAKTLAGEANPAEAAEVQAWAAASPDNGHYLEELRWLWQQAPFGRPAPGFTVDVETALASVKSKIDRPASLRASIGWRWAIAAGLTLVLAAYWFFRPTTPPLTPTDAAMAGYALRDTLTDGTVVALNQQTSIQVAQGYNQRERRLRLKGTAHFAVRPDAQRPFVVEADQVEVKAVGTAFNVEARADEGKVLVFVTEGKVAMTAQNQTLLLKAGDTGVYESSTSTMRLLTIKDATDPLPPVPEARLHFAHGTPLKTIAAQVSKVHGIQIRFESKELGNCPQSEIDFTNRSLEEILSVLADTHNLRYERTANEVVFSGTCSE
jgi:transmembrane sensor